MMAIMVEHVDSRCSGLLSSGAVADGREQRSGEWTRLTATALVADCRHRERREILRRESGEETAHWRHGFFAVDGDGGQCDDGEGRYKQEK